MGLVPVDSIFLSLFIAQKHVFADAHIRDQRQFLMDDDDALAFAVLQIMKAAFLTVIDNIARIASVGIPAAQDVHQRGFPGAVFPYQGMNAAALDGEVDVIQRLDARKLLGDPSHFQYNIRQKIPSIIERSNKKSGQGGFPPCPPKANQLLCRIR